MKTLQDIEAEFTEAIEIAEPQRTSRLVQLMNDLERDYSTFIFNPSQEEMKQPAVQLYKKISLARNL